MVLLVRSIRPFASIYHHHGIENVLAVTIQELIASYNTAYPNWLKDCGLIDIGYLHELVH